jgi:hypothetical protein
MAGGFGAGSGARLDLHVEVRRVSMSVIPVPVPGSLRPEPAERLVQALNSLAKKAVFAFTPISWR